MKKITLPLYLLFFGIFFSNTSNSQVVVNDDYFFWIYNASGNLGNVLFNDLLDGISITNPADVIISFVDPTLGSNFAITPNGDLLYSGFLPCGPLVLNYTLTKTSDPAYFDSGQINVFLDGYPELNNDHFSGLQGTSTFVGNVLTNDYYCGDSLGSTGSPTISTLPAGIDYDYWTGILTIAPTVVPGTYPFTYSLGAYNAIVFVDVLPSITLAITGTYNDFNADGFKNVGDVINYHFTISNNTTDNYTNVILSGTSMSISGTPIPLFAAGSIDTTTFTGIHVLTLADIMAGFVTEDAVLNAFDSLLTLNTRTVTITTSLGITDAIKMNAFIDYNLNNIQDVGEPNFTNGEFHFELNSDGIIHNITDSSGMFTIYETNTSNNYALSYTINPYISSSYNPITLVYPSVNVPTGSGVTIYNFPITEIPFNDLSISFIPYRGPVPGFGYSNYIRYENNGTSTIPSGTITFNHSSNILMNPVSGATPITNGFTYDFTNLLRKEVRYIYVGLNTPVIPVVSLGDLVTNTVSITNPSSDINLSNNVSSLTQDIRGSYDPNDKMESHGEKILFSTFTTSDYLTYTIRFENTGTGNAINIKVDDVLDTKLDPTTVRMIDASAPYSLERTGNNLSWKFNGINLPPSDPVSTTVGKGYITFQVKPNAGFAIGDIIPNAANIYFDFNPAIITNTFQSEFVSTLTTNQFNSSAFEIYPNPTSNILNIKSQLNILSTEITDINGRTIQSSSQNSNEVVLNLENLQSGIYLLKVETENGSSTQKIIKK